LPSPRYRQATHEFLSSRNKLVAERFLGTLNAVLGKVVSDSQKDWDLQLPFVVAAYRSIVHASTNFTPNYLMMAREVRASVDLVFGTPVDQPPVSYYGYSVDVENRFKQAYALVREHLGVAAERMKRQYDIRVRPQKFEEDSGFYIITRGGSKAGSRSEKESFPLTLS